MVYGVVTMNWIVAAILSTIGQFPFAFSGACHPGSAEGGTRPTGARCAPRDPPALRGPRPYRALIRGAKLYAFPAKLPS